MSTETLRDLDLSTVHLISGHGAEPAGDGPPVGCVMDLVAWRAGEAWSDTPECASPVLTAFCQRWNDGMDDADRQMLVPYIDRLIGTRSTSEIEERRAWMALNWSVRVSAPAWLRLAKLDTEADALEALPEVVDAASARVAQGALDAAATKARAAKAAARAAAGDSAWAAARAAAWAADSASAGDAAGAAAWAAARDSAWAAARAAAWAAAGDAAVRPTVEHLQCSALVLLDSMIEVGVPNHPTETP